MLTNLLVVAILVTAFVCPRLLWLPIIIPLGIILLPFALIGFGSMAIDKALDFCIGRSFSFVEKAFVWLRSHLRSRSAVAP